MLGQKKKNVRREVAFISCNQGQILCQVKIILLALKEEGHLLRSLKSKVKELEFINWF